MAYWLLIRWLGRANEISGRHTDDSPAWAEFIRLQMQRRTLHALGQFVHLRRGYNNCIDLAPIFNAIDRSATEMKDR